MSIKNINDLLKVNFVAALINKICGQRIELIQRPASYIVRSTQEKAPDLSRVLILPPKGYTANAYLQTNAHDEALKATIKIHGGVREGKHYFSTLKDCLLMVSFNKSAGVSNLNKPYVVFDDLNTKGLTASFHSANTPPFSVVKPNGIGFYHNLINQTEDWLVLELKKTLRTQRSPKLKQLTKGLTATTASLLHQTYEAIITHGDELFQKEPVLIQELEQLPIQVSLPALIEMLYAYDTGKHEACTAFALILKVGKQAPSYTVELLLEKMQQNEMPSYYGEQLVEKINRFGL